MTPEQIDSLGRLLTAHGDRPPGGPPDADREAAPGGPPAGRRRWLFWLTFDLYE